MKSLMNVFLFAIQIMRYNFYNYVQLHLQFDYLITQLCTFN